MQHLSVDGSFSGWVGVWATLDAASSRPTWQTPELCGANAVTLGQAALGATYSAAVDTVGTAG